mgnify:CR=1 FL=1
MGKHVKIMDKHDAEIVEERYNPLIDRLEVVLRVVHFNEGTPSRGVLKSEIAKIYGKDPHLVYIRRVQSTYGLCETTVEAHIYNSLERAKKFEPEYIAKRDEESLKKTSTTQQ